MQRDWSPPSAITGAISILSRRRAHLLADNPAQLVSGLLARPDAATAMVVAQRSVRWPDRRAGDAHHRSRPISRRRGHRGFCARPAIARDRILPDLDVATASTASLRFATGAVG